MYLLKTHFTRGTLYYPAPVAGSAGAGQMCCLHWTWTDATLLKQQVSL